MLLDVPTDDTISATKSASASNDAQAVPKNQRLTTPELLRFSYANAHSLGTTASIIFYRERQDAPVHAIAAEAWQGSNKILAVHPIHCLELSPAQVVEVMTEILSACSIELNVELSKFASKVELHPSLCPIRPFRAV